MLSFGPLYVKLSHMMSDRSLLLGKSFNQVEASSSARIHIGNKFPASLFLAEASCCAMPPVNQKPLAEQKHSAGKLKISQERLFGKCPTLGRSPWQNWGLLLDLMVERSLLLLGLSLEHNWVDALLLIKASCGEENIIWADAFSVKMPHSGQKLLVGQKPPLDQSYFRQKSLLSQICPVGQSLMLGRSTRLDGSPCSP